ncbi:Response_reg domain-containing protein/Myb_DNA-binding domain-containing protein [Cephalotus follicularis]|uniref:Response_reg domain-containing protein/Myb_DNA-binding domain-containing protein n=1 Tax=Cephalotus follicularis TaxID=3775 RepID=A0A1Q3CKZ1_CEPFO|nr:Response_reg domain-containing protein/Myb_DNA-binding domain-containing protein [Cephalotus follicularis]
MVCTANDLLAWKDFPKGLKILLLDEDSNSAAEIKSKLEAMDYIVSIFCDEKEALSAITDKPESFHAAIVEVTTINSSETYKFLETAKDMPTIMTSNTHCLSTMIKCIALGAVEFLWKPLSEEKLRNIWQHVVHKAFNAGGTVLSESLKPIKESVVSMLHLRLENGQLRKENSEETENVSLVHKDELEQSGGSDKYPAPSTPQLKQGGRSLDDGDCQDHANCSTEKESGELDGESKSVETTCGNSITEENLQPGKHRRPIEVEIKEEDDSANNSKSESHTYFPPQSEDILNDFNHGTGSPSKASGLHNSCVNRTNRKKMKVDWTPDLHKKFVQAVEQLGVDQAIPSRILDLMKVEGLTRHNVASHLQKYRMHRRHILPKEDGRRWPQPRDQKQRGYYPHKPIMAFPAYQTSNPFPAAPVYPLWGAPSSHPRPAGVHMWGSLSYPSWQPAESWHWTPYPAGAMNADAWGCPVMPPPHGPCSYPQNSYGFHNSGRVDSGYSMSANSFELYPAQDVIDKVVKEAISMPWLPLPLGLKPPSIECVLAELSKQGISTILPDIKSSINYHST